DWVRTSASSVSASWRCSCSLALVSGDTGSPPAQRRCAKTATPRSSFDKPQHACSLPLSGAAERRHSTRPDAPQHEMGELVLWQLDAIDLGPVSVGEREVEDFGLFHALLIGGGR